MVVMQKFISASILSADFSRLGKEVKRITDAGVDYIHFDVMDHHFVPNLSFGTVICKALLQHVKITVPIDVHLMVDNPEAYIKPFAEVGASLITFHPETVKNVEKTIELIHKSGMQSGLAFNPDKPISLPSSTLKQVNLILLMSVNPGFSGQSFILNSLERIQSMRKLLNEVRSEAMLGVDGGIKADNITRVSCMGANFFVVGSGLFHASNYKKKVKMLRQQLDLND